VIKTKQLLLAIALVATLVATYLAPDAADTGDLVPAGVRERARALRSGTPGVTAYTPAARVPDHEQVSPKPWARDESERASSTVFEPAGWAHAAPAGTTPPKTAAKPVPGPLVGPVAVVAPAPVAPPLPFKALGWYREGERRGAFVQYQGSNLVVHVGDKVGNDYVFESWTDRSLSVRYLPLNQLQTLEVGAYEN
jgi:hypothetical protein